MQEVFEFLKKSGVYYIATSDNGQPRVRPFGAAAIIDGKLCFPTNNQKKVYAQLISDPRFEICSFFEGKWIRIEGKAKLVDTREARAEMINQCPPLADMYDPDDGIFVVFAIEEATATIASFTDAPKTIKF